MKQIKREERESQDIGPACSRSCRILKKLKKNGGPTISPLIAPISRWAIHLGLITKRGNLQMNCCTEVGPNDVRCWICQASPINSTRWQGCQKMKAGFEIWGKKERNKKSNPIMGWTSKALWQGRRDLIHNSNYCSSQVGSCTNQGMGFHEDLLEAKIKKGKWEFEFEFQDKKIVSQSKKNLSTWESS